MILPPLPLLIERIGRAFTAQITVKIAAIEDEIIFPHGRL